MTESTRQPTPESNPPAERNIKALARLEEDFRQRRSLSQRISDAITRFIGSMTFVVIHLVAFLAWVIVNLNLIPGIRAFDPFPFGILTLFVSAEGVMLTTFVLISQNRMTRDADRQAKLDLQVSLLAEAEATKLLQLTQAIAEHLGIHAHTLDQEARELSRRTEIETIARQVEERLPDE